jgi:hypothetical protein
LAQAFTFEEEDGVGGTLPLRTLHRGVQVTRHPGELLFHLFGKAFLESLVEISKHHFVLWVRRMSKRQRNVLSMPDGASLLGTTLSTEKKKKNEMLYRFLIEVGRLVWGGYPPSR